MNAEMNTKIDTRIGKNETEGEKPVYAVYAWAFSQKGIMGQLQHQGFASRDAAESAFNDLSKCNPYDGHHDAINAYCALDERVIGVDGEIEDASQLAIHFYKTDGE